MNKILQILLVLLFSLTIISCGSDDCGSSASTDNTSSTTTSDEDSTTEDNSSSTSWNGTYGTIVVPESDYFNIGSGNLWWSSNVGSEAFFIRELTMIGRIQYK